MKISRSRLLKGVLVFVFLALFLILLRLIDPGADSLTRFVDEHIRSRGFRGGLLFVFLAGGLACFGLPRQVISFLGGYAFGMIFGTIWATISTTLGCALSFLYARFVGRSSVERRFGKQVARINDLVRETPFAMVVCIRLLPMGNNLLTCLLGGVSRIPAGPFIAGSCCGYIPQNLIFALLGSGIRVDPFWRTALSAVLFAASSLIGWWIYRRFRLNRIVDAAE
ncbi:MAG: VTT domain-containing protein [Deltaproteobacteria bacterium]|jgi:uncharacterized membrane protein YdjX (TVP38/TMEM64 family)|nr:VTT domain-containing protein [Deltaproteobacteria bacterium]